jgi:hypothetical protein
MIYLYHSSINSYDQPVDIIFYYHEKHIYRINHHDKSILKAPHSFTDHTTTKATEKIDYVEHIFMFPDISDSQKKIVVEDFKNECDRIIENAILTKLI